MDATEGQKSILKNVLYGFSSWLLPLGLSFITTPILVRSLGHTDFGIYVLVLGFIGYSFNFSIGRAITKYISEYRVNGEVEKIRDVISATLFVNLAVGLTGLTIIVSLSKWFVTDIFKIEASRQTETLYALYLAAPIIFFSMLSQIFNAVVQGLHRFDVYSKILNLNSLAILLGNLLLALSGFGLLALLSWNLGVTVLICLIYAVAARRLLPEFGIHFGFPAEMLKQVIRYSSGVIGYQMVANFLLLFERSWITAKLGSENLTYYVVPMGLAINLHGFVGSLTMVIFPLVSELSFDRPKLLRLYTRAMKIVCLLVVFMATTLIVQSRSFLTLWMGADFAAHSWELLILHTISFSLAAIGIMAYQTAEGMGFPGLNFLTILGSLIIFAPLMIWLTPVFGNFGAALARTIGFSVWIGAIIYIENRFFGKIQSRFWVTLIGILAIGAGLAVLTEKLITANLILNWFSFILSVAAGGLVYLMILWVLGLIGDEEKKMFRGVFKRS